MKERTTRIIITGSTKISLVRLGKGPFAGYNSILLRSTVLVSMITVGSNNPIVHKEYFLLLQVIGRVFLASIKQEP